MTYLLPDYHELTEPRLAALQDIGDVETYSVEKKWWPGEWRIRQALRRLEPMRPFWILDRTPACVRDVQHLFSPLRRKLDCIDPQRFDLVHVVHLHLASVLRRTGDHPPATLDWDNELTIVLRRMLETGIPFDKRLQSRLEIARIWGFQAQIASRFRASFAASEADADRLAQCTGGRRPRVVPNGVDTDYFRNPRPGRPPGNTLIYTGHMSYGPNIDAMQFFCREILPLVALEVPDVRLLIVGTSPDKSVTALERDYGNLVTVTGEVADVRPYLTQAAVSVVPLRAGGGTRLKILESLAMHRPVVTTSIGCEGLEVHDGEHVLIRDDVEAFASAVVGLLKDRVRWLSLAERGEALLRAKYRWDAIAKVVAATWLELIDSHRGQKGSW